MRNVCLPVINAEDDSVTIVSSKIDAQQLVSASFIAVFSDTDAQGTLSIEASNEAPPQGNLTVGFEPSADSWASVPSASSSVTVGGKHVIAIPQSCYRWLRVRFEETTPGTGALTVNMNALGI